MNVIKTIQQYPSRHQVLLCNVISDFILQILAWISKRKVFRIFKWFCPLIYLKKELEKQLTVLNLTPHNVVIKAVPRGIRNNNWLNIEKSRSKWKGLANVQPDERFASFTNPIWSLRAGIRIARTYKRKYDITTVSGLVARFAPKNENDTQNYINYILDKGIDDEIRHNELIYMRRLIRAMCEMENGRWEIQTRWCDEIFDAAFELA